jgi:hypothetical protein
MDVFTVTFFSLSRLEALVLVLVPESHSEHGRFLKIFMYFLARRRRPLFPPLGKKNTRLRGSIVSEYLSLKV